MNIADIKSLYGKHYGKLIEIELLPSSPSARLYGNSVSGILTYPAGDTTSHPALPQRVHLHISGHHDAYYSISEDQGRIIMEKGIPFEDIRGVYPIG